MGLKYKNITFFSFNFIVICDVGQRCSITAVNAQIQKKDDATVIFICTNPMEGEQSMCTDKCDYGNC